MLILRAAQSLNQAKQPKLLSRLLTLPCNPQQVDLSQTQ